MLYTIVTINFEFEIYSSQVNVGRRRRIYRYQGEVLKFVSLETLKKCLNLKACWNTPIFGALLSENWNHVHRHIDVALEYMKWCDVLVLGC